MQNSKSTEDFIALEATLMANEAGNINMEEGITLTATTPPIESLVNDVLNLQPINISKEVVRNDIRAEHESVYLRY
jgi:hypothetical protein